MAASRRNEHRGRLWINTSGEYRMADIYSRYFSCILLDENCCILVPISLGFVPNRPTDNEYACVQVMAWHRTGAEQVWQRLLIAWIHLDGPSLHERKYRPCYMIVSRIVLMYQQCIVCSGIMCMLMGRLCVFQHALQTSRWVAHSLTLG